MLSKSWTLTGKLKHFCSEVFEDGSSVDSSSGTYTLRLSDSSLKESVDTSDRELECTLV